MATLAKAPALRRRLSIVRGAATGALAFAAMFGLCWLGAALGGLNASHMYVALFTVAPAGSLSALASGLCWSLAFGGLGGALIALTYDGLAFLEK